LIRLLLFSFSIFFTSCNLVTEDKDLENTRNLSLLYLLNQRLGKRGIDFNCNTSPSPRSFNEFLQQIDTFNTSSSKCSGCHGATTAQANFIITNYTSVLERISGVDPSLSLLYLKVNTGGSMAIYSNSTLNQAIYCYILNGSPQ
jgi:hypothetical protein